MSLKLDKIQRYAESLLVDSCRIMVGSTRAGPGAWNEATGEYTPPAGTVLFDGPCMIQSINSFPTAFEAGTLQQVENYYWIRLPLVADMSVVFPEDVLVCTAIHVGGDTSLLNQKFIIQDYEVGTYSALRNVRALKFIDVPT